MQASREKEFLNARQKYLIFRGRRRKTTTPWRNAGSVFVLGVPRSRLSVTTQLLTKGHPLESQHEGPATRLLQKGGICQAMTIAAFASSCQVDFRSLPLCSPGHHYLPPPHSVEKCTILTVSCFYIPLVALGGNISSFVIALIFPSSGQLAPEFLSFAFFSTFFLCFFTSRCGA